ncbi:MAG: hypothetical protein JW763_01270 [candidate division Zixibacteria bacterium]|nr:hypothetical protein [candidate division Zixibacteria bacterium]
MRLVMFFSIGMIMTVTVFGGILPPASPSDNDKSDPGFNGGAVIDFAYHTNCIWAAGNGVNETCDLGGSWVYHDSDNTDGVVGNYLSAIYTDGARLWIGSNHMESDQLFSDGLSYTDDAGSSWQQVDFGPTGHDIPNLIGVNYTIYDIAGHDDQSAGANWIFIAAYAGGFVGTNDGGQNWKRLFPTPDDSVDYVDNPVPSLRNRYFACAADISHGDSLFVWTGTAGGIFQYIFADNDISPDTVLEHVAPTIPGNYIYAIGIHYQPSGPADVWVSCRPVDAGETTAIIKGEFVGDQISWTTQYEGLTWNYAFNGDTVFLAADTALLYAIPESKEDWTSIPLILQSYFVYGIDYLASYIWVGTDECAVQIAMDDFTIQYPSCEPFGRDCCMNHGIPGDNDKNGAVNLLDVLNSIDYVYVDPVGEPHAVDGCDALYDANGDGVSEIEPLVNLLDILSLIEHIYQEPVGEPVLCCPPDCRTPE